MRKLLLLLLFIPTQTWAIVNIEDLDLSLSSDGQKGRIGFAVKGASGNTDKISGEASGRFIMRNGKHFDMLTGSFSYGRSRGIRDTNKSFLHLRHRYSLSKPWELEAFTQAQQDEFARLKLRLLIGGGVRRSYKDERLSLYFGLGSFYERESLRGGIAVTNLWRGNFYVAGHYALNERVRFQNTIYFQPAWQDFGDQRISDAAVLRVSLTETIDIRLAIELSYDSRPPATVRSTDINYTTGLEFSF